MTPVHPIETSGGARQSRDRRPSAGRYAAIFRVPGAETASEPAPAAALQPLQGTALITVPSDHGGEARSAGRASQTFVENVNRLIRAPQRLTGWFVDLTV